MFTLSLLYYRTHSELKIVSNQHIVNTNMSWRHASTNLLGNDITWASHPQYTHWANIMPNRHLCCDQQPAGCHFNNPLYHQRQADQIYYRRSSVCNTYTVIQVTFFIYTGRHMYICTRRCNCTWNGFHFKISACYRPREKYTDALMWHS